jgi:hypothetical protein
MAAAASEAEQLVEVGAPARLKAFAEGQRGWPDLIESNGLCVDPTRPEIVYSAVRGMMMMVVLMIVLPGGMERE